MDLSSYFEQAATMANKVKNAIMNYSEYEAKVYDATNNDPWGTSSTLMMDIANATSHYGHYNDIVNTIYKRLQEPAGPTWRQTYKALQLLEYLIKHGSEKVIDSARGHIYELRVLLHYNYIDEKRKDHGMNVKNRAKEIIELLESDEKIRTERIKAKENRSKYIGVDSSSVGFAGRGGTGSGNFGGSGSKYGGFGPGSAGSRGGRDSSSTFSDANITSSNFSSSRDSELPAPVSQQHEHEQRRLSQTKSTVAVDPPKPKPQQTVNLLDFGGGDDWSDFSSGNAAHAISPAPTGPTTSAFGNFADFSGASSATGVHANHMAPPAGFPPFGMPPMQSGGPTALMKPPQQATQLLESSGVSDFGDFTAFTSAPASTPFSGTGSMTLGSNMQPVQTFQTANGGLGGGFAEFSSSGMSSAMSVSMQTPAKPAAMPDAFSKLVSLDASALTPGAKREEALRPSLNSLGSAQPSGGSIGFGGANYSSGGMLQPMQITTQQRSHPQQSKPQSSIQPQLFF